MNVRILCFLAAVTVSQAKRHNIVLLLTDDQDLMLGGLIPLKKSQNLIGNNGATFTNAFVTTPLCCPSRASILSGKYQHNHQTYNNSLNGGCNGPFWQQHIEPHSWPTQIHDAGYMTFYAGKYLNQYGAKEAGGTSHVPPGWDWWIGLEGNSRYYNYTLSINGTSHFHSDDYLTDLIKTYSLEFLSQKAVLHRNFMMVLATPAPHAPFTPAPKYDGHFKNVTVMRTPNFNTPVHKDKHWLLQIPPSPLPQSLMPELDRVYRQRWETLLSVDDMVESLIMKMDSLGLLENTYIMLTSDHGYHVGQFGLPWDKRQPYEMDIRIPLLIRGPGISYKTLLSQPVLNIDFAPTFLEMAGLTPPASLDGHSFLSLFNDGADNNMIEKRNFLIEYEGEGTTKSVSHDCHYPPDGTLSECSREEMCKCQDSKNNTYSCVRGIGNISEENFLFCEFKDALNFTEAYDLNKDPYQLDNIANQLSPEMRNYYISLLNHIKSCSGESCNSFPKQHFDISTESQFEVTNLQ